MAYLAGIKKTTGHAKKRNKSKQKLAAASVTSYPGVGSQISLPNRLLSSKGSLEGENYQVVTGGVAEKNTYPHLRLGSSKYSQEVETDQLPTYAEKPSKSSPPLHVRAKNDSPKGETGKTDVGAVRGKEWSNISAFDGDAASPEGENALKIKGLTEKLEYVKEQLEKQGWVALKDECEKFKAKSDGLEFMMKVKDEELQEEKVKNEALYRDSTREIGQLMINLAVKDEEVKGANEEADHYKSLYNGAKSEIDVLKQEIMTLNGDIAGWQQSYRNAVYGMNRNTDDFSQLCGA